MVKVNELIPRTSTGGVDHLCWLRELSPDRPGRDDDLVSRALQFVSTLSNRSEEFLEKGMEMANLVTALNMDDQCVAAALLYRPLRTRSCDLAALEEVMDADVVTLVSAVVRMADSSLLEMSNSRMQSTESRDQVENIRRMLVSMIDDARVAILKLAERIVALRSAKQGSEERRRRIAQEALLVFAPLANRLGVWHMKWELEDLALRYLEPEVYMALARQLDGRRAEREAQVSEIAQNVQERLRARGIQATVHGRAKHIFSIWRKMRAKKVGLDEVYDQRAIRIIVPDIGQCYSALGVVHTEWQHIPREFDDYIAVPKENGYRSIHTAVIGDDGKTLEVQIRTPEIHEESELGVCAHWSYKDERQEDAIFTEKMNWMRKVVEWQEETRERVRNNPIGFELQERIEEERIFVYSPKGHVLDLTTGATPLDFAYRVHTQVGHRCLGAKVDGELAALNTPLKTGQRVEIITAETENPQRHWLDTHLHFVKTARAREKIQDWFRARSAVVNENSGREILERYVGRLALTAPTASELKTAATNLGFDDTAALLKALAVGDCEIVDLLAELLGANAMPAQMSLLPQENPGSMNRFSIDVSAHDREGLLLDVTAFFRAQHVSLVSNAGSVNPGTGIATITLEIMLPGLVELALIIDGIRQIPDVIDARRIEPQTVADIGT